MGGPSGGSEAASASTLLLVTRVTGARARCGAEPREPAAAGYPGTVTRGLGVRLHKAKPKDWPSAVWAIVAADVSEVVAHGTLLAPRSYGEADALRHLHEGISRVVHQHQVTRVLVWEIEGSARMNAAMRPRLRAEGVVCAAARLAGSDTELVAWPAVAARAQATGKKAEYESASVVAGVEVGTADSLAVLLAAAAVRR